MSKIRKNWQHKIHLMEDEISREPHGVKTQVEVCQRDVFNDLTLFVALCLSEMGRQLPLVIHHPQLVLPGQHKGTIFSIECWP